MVAVSFWASMRDWLFIHRQRLNPRDLIMSTFRNAACLQKGNGNTKTDLETQKNTESSGTAQVPLVSPMLIRDKASAESE